VWVLGGGSPSPPVIGSGERAVSSPSGDRGPASDPVILIYENDLYPLTCIPKMNFLCQSFKHEIDYRSREISV